MGEPDRKRAPIKRSVEDEILTILQRAGLPPDHDDLNPDELHRTDAVAAEGLARITASRRDPAPLERLSKSSPWTRIRGHHLQMVSMATVTVGLVIVLLALRPWGDIYAPSVPRPAPGQQHQTATPPFAEFSLVSYDSPDIEGAPARSALLELASAASASRPAENALPVQHVTLDSWFLAQDARPGPTLFPVITHHYFLPDGNLRSIEYAGAALDAVGRLTDRPHGPSKPTADETFAGPPEGPDYADSLPVEPAALTKRLIPDPVECPVLVQCLANQMLDLHYTWVVPPKVTAALWRAMANEPGISYLGTTVDRLNRSAVGFAVITERRDRKLILYADPATGELLGSEEVLLANDQPEYPNLEVDSPVVTAFTALKSSRRVAASAVP